MNRDRLNGVSTYESEPCSRGERRCLFTINNERPILNRSPSPRIRTDCERTHVPTSLSFFFLSFFTNEGTALQQRSSSTFRRLKLSDIVRNGKRAFQKGKERKWICQQTSKSKCTFVASIKVLNLKLTSELVRKRSCHLLAAKYSRRVSVLSSARSST